MLALSTSDQCEMKWNKEDFWISDDISDVDLSAVHQLLSTTYWAKDRPRERTEKGISGSVCFSLKHKEQQIGFARVITDGGCYAIVVDVVIDEQFQRQKLGAWLMSVIESHPKFKGMVLILWTEYQVGFYEACGLKHIPSFQIMRKAPDWMGEDY